jgi:L-lactate dehydrogenase complex protein LldF
VNPRTHFSERAERALAQPSLRRATLSATDLLYTLRAERYEELAADGVRQRDRARAIRQKTLARIDEYVEQFVTSAEKNGSIVHFAADAAEAQAIALTIARRVKARLVVKMKSMLTEELQVREAFAQAGIETVETDLGEWILQLAEEPPAHLIMPAMHKTKESIKALFDHHLTPDDRTDAKALVDRAQVALREKFLAADLGITGVNFGVAETGTLLLVSNEGNGRLVTSGPRVHIAFVPIEKLVPTLDEAVTVVQALINSATGQKLSAFINWITGPRRVGEIDGPEELHVVLVDNGRSAALGTELEEALTCLRCGACLNACPVYRRVGGHAYDAVYSGPIGIVVAPILTGATQAADELAHASSLCGACEEVCPVRIDLPRMILAVRRQAVAAGRPRRLERLAFRLYAAVVRRPWLYRLAMRLGALLARLLATEGRIERLPGGEEWSRSRSLPVVAKVPFRRRFARRAQGR